MTVPPRLALIHATRLSIDPVEDAARRLWPEAETVSLLDEALSRDRQRDIGLTDALSNRIGVLARYAEGAGAAGILFTCSAFGPAIEAAATRATVPVRKPNAAMFDAALDHGPRIVLLHSFAPSARTLLPELEAAALARGVTIQPQARCCPDAMAAKAAGDIARHDQLIADAAAAVDGADVILLAQFSMASAAPAARARTGTPILTSPEAAILDMRRRLSPVGS